MGIKSVHCDQYISLLERHVPTSITDTNGVIVSVSKAFCEMTGYTEEELIGKTHNLLRHRDVSNEVYVELWTNIKQGKSWHGRIRNRTKNNNSYWVDVHIEPIFEHEKIVGYQAIRQNITNEAFFEALARIDSLTGLYNHNYIEEFTQLFIDESWRYRLPFSVIMVDLDNFKHVNDTYGHQMGDEVLKTISKIFQGLIRSSDRAGRWGGEEFLILLPQTTYLQAKELAERLCIGVSSQTFEKIGYKTASFGVALLEHGDTLASLIGKADKALYNAKRLGKNQVS